MTESIRKHRDMRVVKSNDLDADMLQIPPVNRAETICNVYKICGSMEGKNTDCRGLADAEAFFLGHPVKGRYG